MLAANFSMFTATRATSLRTHVGVMNVFAIGHSARRVPGARRGLAGTGDLELAVPVAGMLSRRCLVARRRVGHDRRASDRLDRRLRLTDHGPRGGAGAIPGGRTRAHLALEEPSHHSGSGDGRLDRLLRALEAIL